MTDRPVLVAGGRGRVEILRLMYQALICRVVASSGRGDKACGLATLLDAEDLERLAHALVDGVRRNAEAESDFLRRQVLVDEFEALALPLTQAGNALFGRIRHGILSKV
jgi:hypothetical protein